MINDKKKTLLILSVGVVLLLAACSTGVDVTYDELDPILVQDGDLYPGLSGGEIVEFDSSLFGDLNLPASQKARFQFFESDGEFSGGVAVLLYDSKKDVSEAFNLLVYAMGEDALQPSELGERAALVKVSEESLTYVEVVFIRCSAVVDMRVTDTDIPEVLETHAKNLDKRLQALLCP